MRNFGRYFVFATALFSGSVATGSAFAQGPSTVRIETRPYYGAVVTVEAGVRVFRPLPRTSKVIINPHGKSPVSLNLYENRVSQGGGNVNINRNVNSNRFRRNRRVIRWGFRD